MDHESAIETAAAERYFLGEMGEEERSEFEAHFFECEACALNVKTLSAFRENLKALKDEEPQAGPIGLDWARWVRWVQPAWAAPALAVLVLVVGYQNVVVLPGLREAAQPQAAEQLMLRGESRGAPAPYAGQKQALVLNLDWSGVPPLESYLVEFVTATGSTVKSMKAGSPAPDEPLALVVPAGLLKAGHYDVVVSHPESRATLARFRFEIANR